MYNYNSEIVELSKLRSDVESLKSLVFSNANTFKIQATDIINLKNHIVNKSNTDPTQKYLRGDRTWQSLADNVLTIIQNLGALPIGENFQIAQVGANELWIQYSSTGTTPWTNVYLLIQV